MKKLINIVEGTTKQQVNESIQECGAMPTGTNIPSTPPVNMSVNLNAQGVDQIKELLGLMNNAGATRMSPPAPVGMEMPIAIKPEPKAEPDMKDLIKLAGAPEKEEFANEPDEVYGDMDDAVPNGDDLNRKKTQYKKAQDGDNPMATESIRAMLDARYKEIKEGKAKPDFLDMDKDGNKTEPMKKALKDKKKDESVEEAKEEKRAPAKEKEREVTLPSGAKVKSRTVQGWQSQKADKDAEKDRD